MDGLSTFSTEVNSSGVYVLIIKDRLAIAIRSLRDRCVTSVSLTQVLVQCVVGVRLIVLASSSTLYGKVPRLILKKTSKLTQAVVVSEGIFCAARCCVIFHRQSLKVYLHISNGNVQQNLLCAAFCH